MGRSDKKAQERTAWLWLIALMLAYTIIMSYVVLLRYNTFKATAFDLGNMDQVLWNTIHGRPFQFTNQGADWYGPPTRLAIHFEPIILPLSLLYLLPREPQILLIFQTVALAAGALPVFLLTRKHVIEIPLLAPIMAGAYLLTPSLLALNLFDFHPVSLATPLLLYGILALSYQRYTWSVIAFILAASCKEDVPLAIAMLGLLLLWKYKLPRLGSVLLIGGILWSALAFLVIIPHFYPGAQHNNYWYRYEALGSSPGAAVINILLHPWLLFTTFITLDRIYYLANILRSTGFLALLAPEWLLPAVPSLAVNLLSTDPLLYSGSYHYNAAVVPFLMLAAIEGSRRLLNLWHAWRAEPLDLRSLLPSLSSNNNFDLAKADTDAMHLAGPRSALASLAVFAQEHLVEVKSRLLLFMQASQPAFARPVAYLQPPLSSLSRMRTQQWQRFNERMIPLANVISPARMRRIVYAWIAALLALNLLIMIPQLNVFWPDHFPGTREQHIEQLLDMIPANASLSASTTLNPHLSQRLYITLFPAITFSSSEKSINNTVQYIIVDLDSLFPEDRVNTTNELNLLVTSKQFHVLARAEGVILLVRNRG